MTEENNNGTNNYGIEKRGGVEKKETTSPKPVHRPPSQIKK